MLDKTILNNLKEYLLFNKEIIFAYLFGSYVNDTHHPNSDVDIAIYLKDDILDTFLQINYEISKLLKKDADIIVLNKARNIYLLENIINNSIILKDAPKRVDFELIKQH